MYIYIRSMSEAQSKIYDKLTDQSWKIDEHIIKLLLLPDCQEANHWKREIVRFVDHIDKLKGKNKYPDAKFIRKCLSTHNDMIDAILRQVSSNLHESNQRNISTDAALFAVEAYQNWLSNTLSQHGVIYYDEAYQVLDEIIAATL